MVRFEPYALPPEAMARASRLRSEIAGNQMLMARYRLGMLLRKQNFNPNEPRVPAGNPDGGQWASGGGTDSGRRPIRLAANESEENPRRTPLEEILDPTAEIRDEAFNGTLRSIRRLEPKNPQLSSLTGPNFTPSWQAVNEVNAELDAARSHVAAKIADGHAFTAHASEFGVTSKEEFFPHWCAPRSAIPRQKSLTSRAGERHSTCARATVW